MTFASNKPSQDDVSKLIDSLYEELMLMRFEYMKLKRKGIKDIEDKGNLIEELNAEFESVVKTHTIYLRFQKVSGVTNPSHSREMQDAIQQIKSNVGAIVSQIPKANPDAI